MSGPADLLQERITRQGLVGRRSASVAQAAALTCAIQAQDAPASRLGIRVRSAAPTEADVLTAIAGDRSVVRTWLMRGTIHLVDTADVRWLVRVIGPTLVRRFRTRWNQLGLTEHVLDRSLELLPELLAAGPLTRREIATALAERGLVIGGSDPQAHTHLLVNASAVGLVCRGPEHGRDATFTLLDEWVPHAAEGPVGDDALAELARRYFAAFSPATPADFTVWSGLPSTRAIGLIADELTPVDVDGRPGFRLGDVEPARVTRLLPAFDNYLIGYRHRDAIVDDTARVQTYVGGIIRPSVLVDGRVLGTWSLARSGTARVTVRPVATLTRTAVRAVEAEVADIARFLARPVELEVLPC